jgi:hypothetical protein
MIYKGKRWMKSLVYLLNKEAFQGNGTVTTLYKKEFNLYEEGQNQIIKFQYGTEIQILSKRNRS